MDLSQLTFIDLSQTFSQDMPVFPGDPLPEITQFAELSKDGYNGFQLKTNLHVGTHIDAPFHFIQDGAKISDIPLIKFIGAGHLIDARYTKIIDKKLLEGKQIKEGDIVLVFTNFSEKFRNKDYYLEHPEISEEFSQALIEAKVNILGLDFPSPDRQPFKIHKLLLANNILIIENLTNLEKLLNIKNFHIIAIPPKLEIEASSVRVVAVVD